MENAGDKARIDLNKPALEMEDMTINHMFHGE